MAKQTHVEFHTKVAGVTRPDPLTGTPRQQLLATIIRPGQPLAIIPEPNNPVDKNAVALHTTVGDTTYHIGYLHRGRAKEVNDLLANGIQPQAVVKDFTGGDDKSYGLNITISYDEKPDDKPQTEDTPQKKRTSRTKIILAILGMTILCCITIAILTIIIPTSPSPPTGGTEGGPTTPLPDLTTLTVADWSNMDQPTRTILATAYIDYWNAAANTATISPADMNLCITEQAIDDPATMLLLSISSRCLINP